MATNTLGQRMRAAAEAAGLTQRQVGTTVAEATGRRRPYTEAAVGQWYGGKSEPGITALIAFAKLVHADLLWLQTGVRGLGTLPTEGRTVPMISMHQAAAEPIDYTSKQMVHSYYPCSEKAFAIELADNRNAPAYVAGYRVVIDPQRKPSPGAMVLALIGGGPIFGVYAERAGKRVEILALNNKWRPELLEKKHGNRIIGTMTEYAVRV